MIMVRRTLTEPGTAFAGVILETPLARFRPSMARFEVEITPSCSFGRWEFATITTPGDIDREEETEPLIRRWAVICDGNLVQAGPSENASGSGVTVCTFK